MTNVLKFSSVQSMLAALRDERSLHDATYVLNRYPVRFVLFDDWEGLHSFLGSAPKYLDAETVSCNEVDDILGRNPSSDSIITSTQLLGVLSNLYESTILPIFSEVLRFLDKQSALAALQELATLENTQSNLKRRIYLPIVGQKKDFFDFYSSFHRKGETPSPVTLVYDQKGASTHVYLSNDKELEDCVAWDLHIHSTGEWYRIPELEPTTGNRWLCTSRTISHVYSNIRADSVVLFHEDPNPLSLLEAVFRVSVSAEYSADDDVYWKNLLKGISAVSRQISIVDYIHTSFPYKRLDRSNIIKCWADESSAYRRWLLKLLILEAPEFVDDYLRQIITQVDTSSEYDLYYRIYIAPLVAPCGFKQEQMEERKGYVRQFASRQLPYSCTDKLYSSIRSNSKTFVENIDSLYCDSLDFEKNAILEMFVSGSITLDQLAARNSEVRMYLSDVSPEPNSEEPNWIHTYLKIYRSSKIRDDLSSELSDMLMKINGSEDLFYMWWYGLPQSSAIAKSHNKGKEDVKLVWVDGLGAEWVPFINSYVAHRWSDIELKYRFARAELPTTTKFNKYPFERVASLDELYHSAIYTFPKSFQNEIKKVKEIVDELVSIVPKKGSLCVYSDHGATVMSSKAPSLKLFCESSDHEGRCALVNTVDVKPSPFYLIDEEHNYAVALTHQSLSTKPTRESHGGATPEECIVPIIELHRKNGSGKVHSRGKRETSIPIEKAYRTYIIKPVINIEIAGIGDAPDPVHVILKGRVITPSCTKVYDGTLQVEFCFEGVSSGTYNCTLAVGLKRQEFMLIIESGMEEEDLF